MFIEDGPIIGESLGEWAFNQVEKSGDVIIGERVYNPCLVVGIENLRETITGIIITGKGAIVPKIAEYVHRKMEELNEHGEHASDYHYKHQGYVPVNIEKLERARQLARRRRSSTRRSSTTE
jgi:hypothetical protein